MKEVVEGGGLVGKEGEVAKDDQAGVEVLGEGLGEFGAFLQIGQDEIDMMGAPLEQALVEVGGGSDIGGREDGDDIEA